MKRKPASLYVLARGNTNRPVCQHKLVDGTASLTCCGIDMSQWSREFTHVRYDTILCRRKACRE